MLQEYEDKKGIPVTVYKNPKCPAQTPMQYKLQIKRPVRLKIVAKHQWLYK